MSRRALLFLVALVSACGGSSEATAPAPGDAAANDSALADSGGEDASTADSEPADATDAASDGAPDLPTTVKAPEAVPEGSDFALGVASGDATESGALLWTKYSGARALRVVVYRMAGDLYAEEALELVAKPGDGGFVAVPAAGLLASTRYRYVFFETDAAGARVARSPVGRLRTPPAKGKREKLLFGAVSCTKNGREFSTIDHAGSRADLDAFFLLGDTTYNDGATTLSALRAKWAENLGTSAYRKLRAGTSVVATWDDHEIDNNWDPETIAPALVADAKRALFDNLPIVTTAKDRIWRKLSWGDTADVFVLDSRSERRPSTRTGPDAQYLSKEQLAWLEDGLLASKAVFKVILNSVPIAELTPLTLRPGIGNRWEGYAAQRKHVLEWVETKGIKGVLWLSGDYHFASMGRVSASGPGSSAIEALVGPGAQLGNVLSSGLGKPQFDWVSTTNNYATVALDPDTAKAVITFHDGSGAVLATQSYTP